MTGLLPSLAPFGLGVLGIFPGNIGVLPPRASSCSDKIQTTNLGVGRSNRSGRASIPLQQLRFSPYRKRVLPSPLVAEAIWKQCSQIFHQNPFGMPLFKLAP